MRWKRNKEDIIAGILDAIDHKINRISSIMRNVNLNIISAKKYLDYLTEKRMIEEKDGEYMLTDKGRRVLELLREKTKIETELALLLDELDKVLK
jgi:predicted transcriptional regulator